jgi:D-alanyl-D-alanine carboxypeptidase
VNRRSEQSPHVRRIGWLLAIILTILPLQAVAAPYAAMVIDARSGEVLHSRNAQTRLHPASLTKMMTLYVTFEAVERGEITLDTKVRISRNAASEPPSKLGLRSGQKIALRYLIRAAAVKSANDAATALAEAISGSEAAFTARMTRTARAMGMENTTFKNAHGLTQSGHLSTAADMTILGRRLFFDYPQYYNLFSRRSTHAGIKKVNNTNRRFLGSYKGADGIKTGYTRAAGFNLVASAQRGQERIIVTVFGGRSSATRNAKVAELMDLGFRRAPSRVAVRKPAPIPYMGAGGPVQVAAAVARSDRPVARPMAETPPTALIAALEEGVADALTEAVTAEVARAASTPAADAPAAAPNPDAAKTALVLDAVKAEPAAAPDAEREAVTMRMAAIRPEPRGNRKASFLTASREDVGQAAPEVVTRASTSGGRQWGITLGKYRSRNEAERILLRTALAEIETLDQALRKVVRRNTGFEANFVGMTETRADLACRRLSARGVTCETLGP